MSETKIINVAFGKSRDATTSTRYRYDYGQVIEVVGINLPETFEARFSNFPHGESIRVIGTQNKVDVPDGLFLTGEPIYCYITVHDEDTDGRTMYSIKIPVKDSTERTDADPTPVEQDVITQAIASLNNAIDRTTENVEITNTNVELAQESAANAQSYAESANSYAENAQVSANSANTYAENANNSATNAEASAVRASDSETHVGQMVTEVEQIAQRAETASSNAESSASVATQKANDASTSATNAQQSATNAQSYMNSALTSASQALTNAEKTQNDKEVVELAKTSAMTAASEAQNYASSARSASQAVQNMNVEAVTLEPNSDATVEKNIDSATGTVTLTYGIPKGSKGDKGDTGSKGDKGDPFVYSDFTPEQLASLKGEKGDTGSKGDKGDAFTYADFTPEQLASLKGEKGDKGDAFEYSDFTPQQLASLKGEKGDKGDAFEYSDFTPEQLASLKGEKGDTGNTGAKGDTGDSGVYVGTSAPSDTNVNVWINPDANNSDIAITVDAVPTQGSGNAVSSGGVYSALAGKVDAETGKGLSKNDYTDAEKQKVTDATAELSAITTATASDVGKALKAKTVSGGRVTEWEFGETGTQITIDSAMSENSENPLQNKVITSAINTLNNALITYTELTPYRESSGYRLTGDGYCTPDANYKSRIYAVESGQHIRIVSDYMAQFQNATLTPVYQHEAQTLVGEVYGVGTFDVVVPDGATYLKLCTLVNGGTSTCYGIEIINIRESIGNLQTEIDSIDGQITHNVSVTFKACAPNGTNPDGTKKIELMGNGAESYLFNAEVNTDYTINVTSNNRLRVYGTTTKYNMAEMSFPLNADIIQEFDNTATTGAINSGNYKTIIVYVSNNGTSATCEVIADESNVYKYVDTKFEGVDALESEVDAVKYNIIPDADGTIPATTVEYHALYDGLVSDGLITRSSPTYMTDDINQIYPLYTYTIKARHKCIIDNSYALGDISTTFTRPKIFIISGQHGNEYVTPYALFKFIERLCTDYSYGGLLTLCDWTIIPIVNPTGYNARTRYNGNNVDINRDYNDANGFTTEEARYVRDALIADQYVLAMDIHQDPDNGQSSSNYICGHMTMNDKPADMSQDDYDAIHNKFFEVVSMAGTETDYEMCYKGGIESQGQTNFIRENALSTSKTFRNYAGGTDGNTAHTANAVKISAVVEISTRCYPYNQFGGTQNDVVVNYANIYVDKNIKELINIMAYVPR